MSDLSVFSGTYAEARGRFVDAARAAGARVYEYRDPRQQGPQGEPLCLDVAIAGPENAERVLVAGSGTHGIEGYTGSAAQTAWLLGDGPRRLPKNTAMVFFHAHNPWGFAHKARGTEENVDLNRNFVDHARPRPANPGYAEVHPIVTPEAWNDATQAELFRRLDELRARIGEKPFSTAFNGGQFSHADGIYFGGQREQWANTAFREAVTKHVAHAKHAAIIDFHTGIGPWMEHIYLCFHPEGSAARKRARDWWGERAVNLAGVTHKALADYQGVLTDAFAALLPKTEATCIVVEFGTLERKEVQRANLAGRWLRVHGANHPALAGRVHEAFCEAFYPSDPRWRAAALEQSQEVLERGIKGIGG
ncbi:MAG: M14 family metallopeptidase [Burkholderiales bacterium]